VGTGFASLTRNASPATNDEVDGDPGAIVLTASVTPFDGYTRLAVTRLENGCVNGETVAGTARTGCRPGETTG
jgi:hypothetical protein